MPTYEYRCPKGHEFERFQRMSDDPASECPECGQMSERLLSGGAGFIFKGEGFYITDYARKGKSDTTASDQGEGKGAAAKVDGTATDGPAKTETAPKKDTPPAAGSASPATGAKE